MSCVDVVSRVTYDPHRGNIQGHELGAPSWEKAGIRRPRCDFWDVGQRSRIQFSTASTMIVHGQPGDTSIDDDDGPVYFFSRVHSLHLLVRNTSSFSQVHIYEDSFVNCEACRPMDIYFDPYFILLARPGEAKASLFLSLFKFFCFLFSVSIIEVAGEIYPYKLVDDWCGFDFFIDDIGDPPPWD